MTRTQREKVKGKPLGYFHLCTDGLKDRKLFNSIIEYAYGMTVLGLIVLKFDITIYAFSLMPNHIHIIMKGTGANALKSFDYMCKMISANLVKNGFPPLEDYGFKLVEIKDKEQMRKEIIYVLRNGFEKNFATPGGYMWSSGWLYYSDMPRLITGEKAAEMSQREIRRRTGTKDSVPAEWIFHPVLGLSPSSFVDTGMVYKLFDGVKDFESALVKDYEAYVKTARELDESVEFSSLEINDIVGQVLQKHYGGRSLKSLSQDEKCKLAVILSRTYTLNSYQISTSIFLKEVIVKQVINAKDYRHLTI